MDPLAHTLAGAALAETRLRDWTPLAAPALILGANAPDIDAVTMFVSRDLSLGFRRGWTHGVLAMAVLPVVLTLALLLLDRAVARWRGRKPQARAGPLLALAALAVWSHPVLDWLNTYGVRFLMPFDGTWFYGDALFVVDPWVWLLLGASVVLARSTSRVGAAGWIVLGIATTSLVTGFEGAPPAARVAWCIGVAGILGLRLAGRRWSEHVPRIAVVCLAAAALYIAAMVAASRIAERQVAAWLAERDDTPVEIMASPAPGNPALRHIVVADAEHYHFLELDWLSDDPLRVSLPSIDRGGDNRITRAALTAPHVRGLAVWTRFPAYRIEETADGYRVSISDVRYVWRGGGLGAAVVELDRDLQVKPR